MAGRSFDPVWEWLPQRHYPMYRLETVKRQGRFVTAWWLFQYIQYSFLTLFGVFVWWNDRPTVARFSSENLKKWSEAYVFLCLVVCTGVFVPGFIWQNSSVMWAAVVVGGYRMYEVFFAQLYYIMQTRRTRLTSFTRTFLFHLLFIAEAILYTSVVIVQREETTVPHALGLSFQAVTLQGNFLTISADSDNLVQLAAIGCNLIGVVILLASLPVLLGSISKTWEQAT